MQPICLVIWELPGELSRPSASTYRPKVIEEKNFQHSLHPALFEIFFIGCGEELNRIPRPSDRPKPKPQPERICNLLVRSPAVSLKINSHSAFINFLPPCHLSIKPSCSKAMTMMFEQFRNFPPPPGPANIYDSQPASQPAKAVDPKMKPISFLIKKNKFICFENIIMQDVIKLEVW